MKKSYEHKTKHETSQKMCLSCIMRLFFILLSTIKEVEYLCCLQESQKTSVKAFVYTLYPCIKPSR
jgi:hypothetical protein